MVEVGVVVEELGVEVVEDVEVEGAQGWHRAYSVREVVWQTK